MSLQNSSNKTTQTSFLFPERSTARLQEPSHSCPSCFVEADSKGPPLKWKAFDLPSAGKRSVAQLGGDRSRLGEGGLVKWLAIALHTSTLLVRHPPDRRREQGKASLAAPPLASCSPNKHTIMAAGNQGWPGKFKWPRRK